MQIIPTMQIMQIMQIMQAGRKKKHETKNISLKINL